MTRKKTGSTKPTIMYLHPLIYSGDATFIKKFKNFSKFSRGIIFTTTNKDNTRKRIGKYKFITVPEKSNNITKIYKYFIVFLVLPIKIGLQHKKIDLIICENPFVCGLAGCILKYIFNCKLIIEINGDYYQINKSYKYHKRVFRNLVNKITLNAANTIKTLNQPQKQFYNTKFPKASMYCFHDHTYLEYISKQQVSWEPFFLSIGFPFHTKGMDILIDAFKQLQKTHPHFKLFIMGYQLQEEIIKRKIKLTPQIKVIAPGWHNDVAQLMSKCYTYVSASRYEALGRTIIEAMSLGKPIIASRTNGGCTCVADGKSGMLFNIEDSQMLYDKMKLLADNPKLAKTMGNQGNKLVRKNFSEQQYFKKYWVMIRKTLQNH